jgi:hypothetical protein
VQLVDTCADKKVVAVATEALRHLCLDEASQEQVVFDGAVQSLVKVCGRTQSGPICGFATGALVNLSKSKACRTSLIQQGGVIPALVDLIGSSSDATVLANAASAIANLSRDQVGGRMLVLQLPVVAQVGRHQF